MKSFMRLFKRKPIITIANPGQLILVNGKVFIAQTNLLKEIPVWTLKQQQEDIAKAKDGGK